MGLLGSHRKRGVEFTGAIHRIKILDASTSFQRRVRPGERASGENWRGLRHGARFVEIAVAVKHNIATRRDGGFSPLAEIRLEAPSWTNRPS